MIWEYFLEYFMCGLKFIWWVDNKFTKENEQFILVEKFIIYFLVILIWPIFAIPIFAGNFVSYLINLTKQKPQEVLVIEQDQFEI